MQQNRSLYNENLLRLCWGQILAHHSRPSRLRKLPTIQKVTLSILELLIIQRRRRSRNFWIQINLIQSQQWIHRVQLSLLNRTAQQLDRRDFQLLQISCQKTMKKNRNLIYTTTLRRAQGFSRTSTKFSSMTSNHPKRKWENVEGTEAKVEMIPVGKRR